MSEGGAGGLIVFLFNHRCSGWNSGSPSRHPDPGQRVRSRDRGLCGQGHLQRLRVRRVHSGRCARPASSGSVDNSVL